MIKYIDIYTILPEVSIDYEHYYQCEQDVLTPALKVAGYIIEGSWYSGESDSFGPLSRCIQTDKGIIIYG